MGKGPLIINLIFADLEKLKGNQEHLPNHLFFR